MKNRIDYRLISGYLCKRTNVFYNFNWRFTLQNERSSHDLLIKFSIFFYKWEEEEVMAVYVADVQISANTMYCIMWKGLLVGNINSLQSNLLLKH